eukprot:gene10216-11902_t
MTAIVKCLAVVLCLLALGSLVESRVTPRHWSNRPRSKNAFKERTLDDILATIPSMNEDRDPSKVKDSSQYQVKNLPGLDPALNITQYAGLININSTSNGNLFFWFIEANVTNPQDAPLLVWINGGPGCSSMDGLFLENGPYRLDNSTGTYQININPFSWTNVANMLYIDEPVGTGLSYVSDNAGLAQNDLDLEQDFYRFLQEFQLVFPQYADLPFYLSGESYAGHYIPHYANFILTMNEAIANKTAPTCTTINLQGVAIGNGWTHPVVQYDSYSKMGYGAGIIGIDQYNAYNTLVAACQQQINLGNLESDECGNVLGTLQDDSGSNTTSMVNVYDIRLYDPTGGSNWPVPGIYYEADYLNQPAVRLAINAVATPQNWSECNGTVGEYLGNTDASSLYLFPSLLSKIRVLIYNGQFDLICNHLGTTEYLDGLEWSGAAEWSNAQRYIWDYSEADGTVQTAGYTRTAQNLTFALVLGGSHMVPYNVPEPSLDMMSRFLKSESFQAMPQSAGVVPTAPSKGNNSPLATGAWIGIIVAGFVGGIIIGAVAVLIASRRSGYQRIN